MIVGAHVHHIEVVLDEFGISAAGAYLGTTASGCLGYVSPWLEDSAPTQEWCG